MAVAKSPLVVFDASVLVAACIASHPDHVRSRARLQSAIDGNIRMAIANHTLAELYSVISSLPLTPRVSPTLANQLIEQNVVRNASLLVTLESQDYLSAIRRLSETGFRGGVTYDMLVVVAYEKVNAKELVTLNIKDFDRIAPGVATFP